MTPVHGAFAQARTSSGRAPLVSDSAPDTVASDSVPVAVPGLKSPGTARALALVGTLAPLAAATVAVAASKSDPSLGVFLGLEAAGLVIGPGSGDLYAGTTGHAVGQMALRAVVLGAAFGAAEALCSGDACTTENYDFAFDFTPTGTLVVAALIATTGVVVTSALAAHDLKGLKGRVLARNAELRRRVSLTPTLDLANRGVGIGVRVRF
jgi:hypothetical protein